MTFQRPAQTFESPWGRVELHYSIFAVGLAIAFLSKRTTNHITHHHYNQTRNESISIENVHNNQRQFSDIQSNQFGNQTPEQQILPQHVVDQKSEKLSKLGDWNGDLVVAKNISGGIHRENKGQQTYGNANTWHIGRREMPLGELMNQSGTPDTKE